MYTQEPETRWANPFICIHLLTGEQTRHCRHWAPCSFLECVHRISCSPGARQVLPEGLMWSAQVKQAACTAMRNLILVPWAVANTVSHRPFCACCLSCSWNDLIHLYVFLHGPQLSNWFDFNCRLKQNEICHNLKISSAIKTCILLMLICGYLKWFFS